MFDIGWSELVVIAVVALIAIGPKELPGVLRMVGQWMGKARTMAAEFQGQVQEATREPGNAGARVAARVPSARGDPVAPTTRAERAPAAFMEAEAHAAANEALA